MAEYKKYLVTGGAGFIGSHLVEELVRRQYQVRVLDDFSSGKEENLAPFNSKIEIIRGDIRNMETCRRAAAGMEVILHEAALASVPRSISEPFLAHEINLTGTLNLLQAAVEAGTKSFVFASSSAVYGDDQVFPKQEGSEGKPLSPYAAQKLASEKYCQVMSLLHDFNAISLRYFNVFGPRQDPNSQYAGVIPIFIKRLLAGQPPVIYGDGGQTRDFIYVGNVVKANLLAAQAECFRGEVFNIGSAERITINDLAREIASCLGQPVKPEYAPPRPGDIRDSYASLEKARKLLGFEPEIDFRQGLRLTVDWYKKKIGEY